MKRDFLNTIAAGMGTIFTYFFGVWDAAISVLITFMVLDYITGVWSGFINKTLSSAVGFKGLTKKSAIFVVLIITVSLDRLLNGGTWVFRTLVCYFYVANEAISILENLAKMGVQIPTKLLDVLAQLKSKGNK
jgi:toxin secretion/phage lysis holin